jgi:hypothetical protein
MDSKFEIHAGKRLLATRSVMLVVMQQWEYRIFASHVDPADLVVIMNDSGKEGWELVTVVAVTDYQPLDLIEPGVDPEKAGDVVQLEAFRYIFKRPVS